MRLPAISRYRSCPYGLALSMASPPQQAGSRSSPVVLDLVERYPAIGCVFARKAKYPFANHVAGHLRCAAAELRGLPRQVAFADEEQLGRPVDDAGAAGDRQRGIDFERNFLGLEQPDERSGRRRE